MSRVSSFNACTLVKRPACCRAGVDVVAEGDCGNVAKLSRMSVVDSVRDLWTSITKDLSVIQKAGLVSVFSASVVVLIQKLNSYRHAPPGPWGFPIVGHLPMLGEKPDQTFREMRKKYGDIIRLQLGSWPTVVLSGDMIKEALCAQGDAFAGRPSFFSAVSVQNGKSLSFGNYDGSWKVHRKIANKAVIAFGNAKNNPIEQIVQDEVNHMISEFEGYSDDGFDPHDHVYLAVASVIYQLCYGQKENVRTDQGFCDYILLIQTFSSFAGLGNPIDYFPLLRHFMPKKVREFKDFLRRGHLLRRKRIQEHVDTFDGNYLRDICDSLISTARTLSSEDKNNGLTEDRVMDTVGDMFAAGFDTVATSTLWMILLLAMNPRVQKKIQDELDDKVGMSRRATLADRNKLVYLEATIHEVMRIINLSPFALPHATTKDAQLGGYTIKKGTLVFVNLGSLSHDPEFWGDPDVFRPERFLTDNGEIDSRKVERFLPYSAGRRRCIGENLARIELYIILSGFMQRLTFVKPKSAPEYVFDGKFGLNQKPLAYKVGIVARI